MKKLVPIFSAVLLLHFGVIGVLLVSPGCQSTEKTPAVSDTSVTGEADGAVTVYAPESPSPDAAPKRLPPTRPQWNLLETSEPVPLPGYNAPEVLAESPTSPQPTVTQGQRVPVEPEPVTVLRPQPAPQVQRPQPVVASSPNPTEYTVVSGDNLTRIAKKLDVSLDRLLTVNGLTRQSIIRPGQRLRIPEGGNLQLPTTIEPAPVSAISASDDVDTVEHVVVSGDTLSGLAARYRTTAGAIRSANSLRNDTIIIGQRLLIPQNLLGATPLPANVGASNGTQYEVQRGDTLGAIASRFGTSVRALMSANNISDPRRLRAGQVLVIPGRETINPPSPPSPPAPVPQTPANAPESPAAPAAEAVDFDRMPEADAGVDFDNFPVNEVEEVD